MCSWSCRALLPPVDGGPAKVRQCRCPRPTLPAIRTKVPNVSAAAGTVSGSAPLVVGDANLTTSVTGVNEDFLEVRDWPVAEGRSFTEAELRSGAKVVILGATTTRELFGTAPCDRRASTHQERAFRG